MEKLQSYMSGEWQAGAGAGRPVRHAVTGESLYEVTSEGLDMAAMLDFARQGGKTLAAMSFHQRALMLKNLASHLASQKEDFYALSTATGATRKDGWIDIEGGFATLFTYSSLVRRELSDERILIEDDWTPLSRKGGFGARHILTPKPGVAVHINAFNFPVWGMLEKLAPTLLAGMPAIIKPATDGAQLAQAVVKSAVESGILPAGALQIICGGVNNLLDLLGPQDVVTFTGSAQTGQTLRAHPNFNRQSIPFTMEADSVNSAILAEGAGEDAIKLFVREVMREMTTKAGQKCTAIRRAFMPRDLLPRVKDALLARLGKVVLGDPAKEGVTMGPLASQRQLKDVSERVEQLSAQAEILCGGHLAPFEVQADEPEKGAFYPPTLLLCNQPKESPAVHTTEAFGPVCTLLPYDSEDELVELVALGEGSLVASVVFEAGQDVSELVGRLGPWHGRLHLLDPISAEESTGHGSPLPHLVHGGPGRAGGGQELGGLRAVKHYMQRTAIQASPGAMSQVTHSWNTGAPVITDRVHPFRKYFDELAIGEQLKTARRTVTEADLVNFGCLSGDHFYAHMDKIAAAESLFGERVAHGYFVVSAAAGLFVDAAPGPVIANYGMEGLRFIEPVKIGDTIQVEFTCKQKTRKPQRNPEDLPQGVVVWDIKVKNQRDELVASYDILTLVQAKD
ncbi:oxepin-CoA hydrolase/3-oxo-5,6-dehydrosuberyl-CoA semialdehyde dehydrogenase [Oceanisphaera litoralis]|uniref:phenylacetic acid degradation bifunctional protein PaaZ n=1 Tax=Oceanisphaera litoralis TaxID=225144 RepID=UPI00195C2B14|nr:phenylacetic acid degradation bifunctional protein PaaZ [Oceanisphaera litoralis]MBM7454205.1 oxepin-CoA hydrolase/3-oxo-5,6-dehydrosuberyl-CoA semialdehyde dehydrogenase [Oceanisphaera litoralis]